MLQSMGSQRVGHDWMTELKILWVLVTQSCPNLCGPVNCSPPVSSVHEIFQARILEWVAISFSRAIFLTQGLKYVQLMPFYRWEKWGTERLRNLLNDTAEVLKPSFKLRSVWLWSWHSHPLSEELLWWPGFNFINPVGKTYDQAVAFSSVQTLALEVVGTGYMTSD